MVSSSGRRRRAAIVSPCWNSHMDGRHNRWEEGNNKKTQDGGKCAGLVISRDHQCRQAHLCISPLRSERGRDK